MKKYNKQQGSAHVIIIIILVLVILGLLGFVFWQNFIVKNTNDSATKTESQTTSKRASSVSEQTPAPTPETNVTVHIADLGLNVSVPSNLSDLTSEPKHLAGDQAVNSVVLSTAKLETAGCARSSAPLGYLTYDSDKGGTKVASARGSNLYYLEPDTKCSAVTSSELNSLKAALKSLVSDS